MVFCGDPIIQWPMQGLEDWFEWFSPFLSPATQIPLWVSFVTFFIDFHEFTEWLPYEKTLQGKRQIKVNVGKREREMIVRKKVGQEKQMEWEYLGKVIFLTLPIYMELFC